MNDASQPNPSREEERASRGLYGDGGFASWERTLGSARPENRPWILDRALRELWPIGADIAEQPPNKYETLTHDLLINQRLLARPKRFELLTPRFVVWRSFSRPG
jgi:hypothetical protein